MSRDDSSPRRCAFITGAGVGLGQATAIALAREGYDLALADIEAGMLAETLAHPDIGRVKTAAIGQDLRSQEQIERGFDQAVKALGGVDVLVNNAGRQLRKPAIDVTWDEWDDVMAINAKGAFFLSMCFARYCFDNGRPGSIINIASTHGITGVSDVSVYGISKAALSHITRMLAIEWATKGVRVNAVAPGTVLTPSRLRSLTESGRLESARARIPIGRYVLAEEIAAAVRYLASPAADAVNGHVLVVDGGTSVI